MGQAIGQLLPFAVGVAISPVPIIAIILMLLSKRAGLNGGSFLAGWVVGIVGTSTILLVLANTRELTSDSGAPSTTSSVIKLVLGLGLLALSRRNFAQRPTEGDTPELPAWLSKIEGLSPPKAAGLGVLLSAVNPKNLLLIAGAMMAVSQIPGLSTREQIGAVVVFVLIAISTVAAPVVIYVVIGPKAQRPLDSMKVWLGENNAVVMAVLLLVIGVKLIGDAISGFTA